VIGASTGGPQALAVLLQGMAPILPHVPVFVVLHIPPEFTSVIAGHIQKLTDVPAHAARQGEQVAKGHIYFSPGNLHLGVARTGESAVIVLSDKAPENFCRPAVDFLFRSAAHTFGPQALGIILTGMGSDGLIGSRAIIEAGGKVLVQDEASSIVWGMPGSVANEELATAILPIEAIAGAACGLVQGHGDRSAQS
jgi:two-component system chemotaxis response regulator CheB